MSFSMKGQFSHLPFFLLKKKKKKTPPIQNQALNTNSTESLESTK